MMLNVEKMGIVGEIKEINLEKLVNSNGKTVANADIMVIYTTEGIYEILFSYDTLICVLKGGYVYRLGKHWDFSVTTGKHRNLFLKLNKKDIEKFKQEKMMYNSELEQYVLKGDE